MIEEFSFVSQDNIELKLNLGVKVNYFQGISNERIRSFYKGQSKGIQWKYHGRLIKLFEMNKIIIGLPSVDKNKIIAIYSFDDPAFPAPSNAVLYNADGSMYKPLTVPPLISDLAKQKKSQYCNLPAPYGPFFQNILWEKNAIGEIVNEIQIGFGRDWYESRVLNSETGEFGECRNSGLK